MDSKQKELIKKLIHDKFPLRILEKKLIKENYSIDFINELLYKDSKKKILNLDPLVYIIDDFLSNEECDHMIKLGNNNLKRAMVSNDKKGVISEGRTGSNNWIPHNKSKKK